MIVNTCRLRAPIALTDHEGVYNQGRFDAGTTIEIYGPQPNRSGVAVVNIGQPGVAYVMSIFARADDVSAACVYPSPTTGGFELSDIGDFFEGIGRGAFDFVTDPKNWLRAVSLMGWPGFLAASLPGLLGTAAEAALVALPGLAQGEPFSDAFVGEVAWRMKAYSLYLTANGFYNAADAAVQTARAIPEQIDRATGIGTEAGRLEQRVRDLKYMYPNATGAQILARLNMTPDKLLQDLMQQCLARGEACREDVQALVANYVAHAPLFNTKDFDLATGRRIKPSDLQAWRRLQIAEANAAQLAAAKAAYGDLFRPPGDLIVTKPTSIQYYAWWEEENAKFFPDRRPERVADYRKRYEQAIADEAAEQQAAEEQARNAVTAAPPPDEPARWGIFGQAVAAAVLTAPAWVPIFFLPWLRRRG